VLLAAMREVLATPRKITARAAPEESPRPCRAVVAVTRRADSVPSLRSGPEQRRAPVAASVVVRTKSLKRLRQHGRPCARAVVLLLHNPTLSEVRQRAALERVAKGAHFR
jgi:hypothetical protein